MDKVDFKKVLKHLYQPSSREVTIVDVPEMRFLVIDGPDPYPREEKDMEMALRRVAAAVRRALKKGPAPAHYYDYVVPPLEGLYWMKGGEVFDVARESDWRWKLMVMQPEFVTPELVARVVNELQERMDNPSLARLRLERFREGLSAQIMHVGPYAEEYKSVDRIARYVEENGYELEGTNHGIYVGNPKMAKPQHLRTVLRYPIRKAEQRQRGRVSPVGVRDPSGRLRGEAPAAVRAQS